MIFNKKNIVINTPILIVDSLGFTNKIQAADNSGLRNLSEQLDTQYYKFRKKIPFSLSIAGEKRVFGTSEFSTLRLNDMFIIYSEKQMRDSILRYLVTSSLIYHTLLVEGFIPRGGLGHGNLITSSGSIVGNGFLDAYKAAEKRNDKTRDICAIKISEEFFRAVPPTERHYNLICFYEGEFFIHPTRLNDPDIAQFDNDMIIDLLGKSGANQDKIKGTESFLNNFENYEAAMLPGSKSRRRNN